MTTRVLFLCTHNRARSQLAEAILRQMGGDRFEVASAGSDPGGVVHPLALQVIGEIGGDPSRHRTKGFAEVFAAEWDLVVTVCDDAQEACPVLPGKTRKLHWSTRDPSLVQGTEAERLNAFRAARAQLTGKIELILDGRLGDGEGGRVGIE